MKPAPLRPGRFRARTLAARLAPRWLLIAAPVVCASSWDLSLEIAAAGRTERQQPAGQKKAKQNKPEQIEQAREAFRAVGKSFEKVRELRADYLQVQESLLLAEPIETRGRIFLRADPGCLVLRIEKPTPVWIRSDATTHTIYHPEQGRAERFLFKKNRLASALISCLRADLEKVEEVFKIESYRVQTVEARSGKTQEVKSGSKATEKEPRRAVVTLRPKDERLREALRELRVEFDLDAGLPKSIEQINREGELVRFELSQVEVLEEPSKESASIFSADLPEGTRLTETVVKDRERSRDDGK